MKSSLLLLEIGNSTLKLASVGEDRSITIERFDDIDLLLQRCEAEGEGLVLLCTPVGSRSDDVISALGMRCHLQVIGRESFGDFIGESYRTPGTLGLDRILNLCGMGRDGLVVSCGTAITIDAIAEGRPTWGAIMPGFLTAAEGLHARVPALPLVSLDSHPGLPATTSYESVANGVLLGTARAAEALVQELSEMVFGGRSMDIVLTGGDAELLRRLWQGNDNPEVDEALLFRGMMGVMSDK